MEHFRKISLNMTKLNSEVAMHHLITALMLSPFIDNFCKKFVSNIYELCTRATKFMHMKELKKFRNTTQSDA